MMYKTLHGMTPEYLRSSFVFSANVNSYHLRNVENKLALPQLGTYYSKDKFFIQQSSVVEQPTLRITASDFLK